MCSIPNKDKPKKHLNNLRKKKFENFLVLLLPLLFAVAVGDVDVSVGMSIRMRKRREEGSFISIFFISC